MNPASAMSWSATMLAFGLGLAWKATVILAVTLVVQMLIAQGLAGLGHRQRCAAWHS